MLEYTFDIQEKYRIFTKDAENKTRYVRTNWGRCYLSFKTEQEAKNYCLEAGPEYYYLKPNEELVCDWGLS